MPIAASHSAAADEQHVAQRGHRPLPVSSSAVRTSGSWPGAPAIQARRCRPTRSRWPRPRRTMAGNGMRRTKIATNAAAATAQVHGCPRTRAPTRWAAAITMATTAGFDAREHAGEPGRVPEHAVDPRGADQHDHGGQDEQQAGGDPAARAVQQPADVGGELLRLGAGEQHAVVERVQESRLVDPAAALDQFVVHDRDLARRAAETDEARGASRSAGLRRSSVRAGLAVLSVGDMISRLGPLASVVQPGLFARIPAFCREVRAEVRVVHAEDRQVRDHEGARQGRDQRGLSRQRPLRQPPGGHQGGQAGGPRRQGARQALPQAVPDRSLARRQAVSIRTSSPSTTRWPTTRAATSSWSTSRAARSSSSAASTTCCRSRGSSRSSSSAARRSISRTATASSTATSSRPTS